MGAVSALAALVKKGFPEDVAERVAKGSISEERGLEIIQKREEAQALRDEATRQRHGDPGFMAMLAAGGAGATLASQDADAGFLTAGPRGARDLIGYSMDKKGTLKPSGKNKDQGLDQIAAQIRKRAKTHTGPAIAQEPIHKLTNYDDFGSLARKRDGGQTAGEHYKRNVDAALEELIEKHPDIEPHVRPYAMDRLGRQEGYMPPHAKSQQGAASPGLLSLLAAGGAGATAAGSESNTLSRGAGQVWDDLKGTAQGLLDVAEMPARGLQGLGRVGYGMLTGEGFDESMRQGNDVLQGGTEAAAKRAGDEVFRRTGSAEMATAAYTAVMTASPI